MQLRKVCNHPDLFEPRPVASPLQLPALRMHAPALALVAAVRAREELCACLGGDLAALEAARGGAFAAHRARHLAPPRRLVEELPAGECAPAPRTPSAELRLHLRLVPRAPPAAGAPPPPPPRADALSTCSAPCGAGASRPTASPAALRLAARRRAALRRLALVNERRCWRLPLYGADLLAAVRAEPPPLPGRDLDTMLSDMHDIIDRYRHCLSCAYWLLQQI